ncbi:peptidoglycan-binding protein [Inquilinus sp.]|jgi:hypothetical protein|uniref:peptidoglycan-binding protein n=1 Tax=Inquilinus sp. TaxID=1932117 RepID=UPI00378318C8
MTVTRGVRNNNPGNIDRGQDWQGLATPAEMTKEQKAEKRFAVFRAPEWGIRALVKLLQTYQSKHGLRTIRGIINRWAPPVENDTGAYARAVAKAVGVGPDDTVDMKDHKTAAELVAAIVAHENSGFRYAAAVFDKGLALAGLAAAAQPDHSTRALQSALNRLGASPKLKVDGALGPLTAEAIRRFQAANGLVTSGIADGDTWERIRDALEHLDA